MSFRDLIWSLLLFTSLISRVLAQGDTACKTTSLDWYTSVVGETPCTTYQRLRQICNPTFAVGSMNTSLPPDICNEQISECCCNTIAFGLTMLCLNCQQGTGSGVNGDSGYDAPPGTYEKFLTTNGHQCSPSTNQSFTPEIQTAVCNSKIKIEDDFYNRIYWADGSWFYQFTREFISKDHAVFANNTFTHCNSTILTSNTTSSISALSTNPAQSSNLAQSSVPTPSPSGDNGSKATSLSIGAIVGIVVGVLALCFGAALAIWQYRKRGHGRERGGMTVFLEPNSPQMTENHLGATREGEFRISEPQRGYDYQVTSNKDTSRRWNGDPSTWHTPAGSSNGEGSSMGIRSESHLLAPQDSASFYASGDTSSSGSSDVGVNQPPPYVERTHQVGTMSVSEAKTLITQNP